MKNNRSGKAAIFKQQDITKIRKNLTNEKHRLIFEIALHTGERMGAICQLQVSDVYADAANSVPHETITFQARTRKARPDGTRETRQVPVHENLKEHLKSYQPPESGYLFPGRITRNDLNSKPITRRAVDKYWRELFTKLNMDNRGFSTHSTRRTLITALDNNGVSVKQMKAITGHKNTDVLLGYIDTNPERLKNTINAIQI